MEDLKLTDYGTIVLGNNKEVKVDTFLELLKKCKGYFDISGRYHYRTDLQDFVFNKDSGCFDIETSCTSCYWDSIKMNYCLKLSNKQKELLDQGRPSPELLKLFAFEEECQYINRQEQIRNKFYETGELPTDPEELIIYNDILHQELKETNAEIVKNSIVTSIIPLIFGVSFMLMNSSVQAQTGEVVFCSGLISLFSLAFFVITQNNPFPINKILEEIEQSGIIKDKIKYLNGSEEKRIALEVKKAFTPEGLENQEVKSIANNNNVFLQELKEVKKKIAMLPEEERDSYINELVEIVRSYDLQVTAILDRDKNKVILGDDANLWSLTASMLPELFNLEGRIDQRLLSIKEKQEIKGSLNQFKESIKELKTDKGYTDGWTDDLTSGGVAYATMENGSVTSRRMA